MFFRDSPSREAMSLSSRMTANGRPRRPAISRARLVFPVPGAPVNRIFDAGASPCAARRPISCRSRMNRSICSRISPGRISRWVVSAGRVSTYCLIAVFASASCVSVFSLMTVSARMYAESPRLEPAFACAAICLRMLRNVVLSPWYQARANASVSSCVVTVSSPSTVCRQNRPNRPYRHR